MKKNKIEVLLLANAKGFTHPFATATKGMRAFNKQIGISQKAARDLDHGLSSMAGKFGAIFGGISLTLFTKSIWEAGTSMQLLENSFNAITGSSSNAAREIDFVRKASDKLGLNFQTTIEAYKGISAAAKGTSLEGKTTREIFLGISEASTVLGISADQTAGALLAISQMISKGKVSAEELRGQLGERLPGAFQIAADAMGVTTAELDKMMSSGNLVAKDFLPAFAKTLRENFGNAAKESSDSAVAALNRFQNSWFELKVGVSKSGFMDLATGKINELTAALSDPKVQARIIELSSRFFELADAVLTFTFSHAEAIAKVTGGLIALSALSRALHLIVGVWNGLNAAMITMTGLRVADWLMTTKTALSNTAIAAGGLKGAIGGLAGVFLAWEVGWQIGTFLNKFDIIKKAGILMSEGLTLAFLEIKKAWTWVSNGNVEAVNAEIQQAKQIFSDMYAEVGTKAQKAAAVQIAAHKQVSAAAKISADTQKQVTGTALTEMQNKYKEYANQIIALQDKIAGREKSLAEQLRAMARSGMTDLGAWQDRKREAEEYEQAAKKAAEAGNFDEAVKLADQAKTAYAELNTEVKDGERVIISKTEALKTAMKGTEQAGKLSIDILKQQQETVYKTMDALTEKSGFQDLTKGMDDAKKKWLENWQNMRAGAIKSIDQVEDRLLKIKDKNVTVWINEKTKKAEGGSVGFRSGGQLSGYGGGDKIKALLEAGEFVIRKEAVSKYGSGLFQALNSMRANNIESIRARLGGLIQPIQVQPIRMQTGGMVSEGVGAGAGVSNFNLTVNFPGNATMNSSVDKRQFAKDMLNEFQHMYRNSS